MSHECNLCHGKLKPTLTTYAQWYEGRLIVIERVPALVCEQCGETDYEPDVVERIQAVIWSGAEPVRMMETPVHQLE
jgi:YgiT-type zinc finger domain-containing protein